MTTGKNLTHDVRHVIKMASCCNLQITPLLVYGYLFGHLERDYTFTPLAKVVATMAVLGREGFIRRLQSFTPAAFTTWELK